jgi:AraC family transcriptional regulator
MRRATEQSYQERILRVLIYIQDHLSESMALDELAAVACFSPYHFHRVFRGMVGESVMEHIRRLRLERAAHQLRAGAEPVTQIAFEAGYETHEAFTRAFGALFGVAPSQFRELHRVPAAPPVRSRIHYHPAARPGVFEPLPSGGPTMEVRVEFIPVMRIAFVRHLGPYAEVKNTWEKLAAWAGQRGLLGPDSKLVGIPHDDPEVTPLDKIRYDAGILVDERFQPEGEVGVQTVGGGEYAVATHRGPYRAVGETFAHICGAWLPTSGRELRSAPPLLVARPNGANAKTEEPATDVCLPLVG